jgi:hypothetical protein
MPISSSLSCDHENSFGHQVPSPSVKSSKARSRGVSTVTLALTGSISGSRRG